MNGMIHTWIHFFVKTRVNIFGIIIIIIHILINIDIDVDIDIDTIVMIKYFN